MRRVWISVAVYGLALVSVFITSRFVPNEGDLSSIIAIKRELADVGQEIRAPGNAGESASPELEKTVSELARLAKSLEDERTKTDKMLEIGIYRKLTWFLLIVASSGLAAYVWLLLSFRSTQITSTRSVLWDLIRRLVILQFGYLMPSKPDAVQTAQVVTIVGVTRWHLEQSLQVLTALETRFPAQRGTDAEMMRLVIQRLIATMEHHFIRAVDPQSTEWSALGVAQRELRQKQLEMERSVEEARTSIERETQARLARALEAADLQNRDAAKALAVAEATAAQARREANDTLNELRKEATEVATAKAAAEKMLQDAEVQRIASTREKQQAEEALRLAKEAVHANELLLGQVQACVDFTAERLLDEALDKPLAREQILRALQPLL